MSNHDAISSPAGTSGGAGDPGHDHGASDGIGGARSGGRDGGTGDYRVTPVPGSIVTGICKIKATVEALKKSQFNDHGRYKFSSTDDLYAAVARKMGEVGLTCLALEDKCEIVKTQKPMRENKALVKDKDGNLVMETVQWAHIRYQFVWSTTTETWTDPRNARTVFVQVTGPQTFQAAQSFVEKAYLRSAFKVPSGDMDLDGMPQAETEEQQEALAGNGRKRKSSSAAKKDGTTETFNVLRAAISSAPSLDDLMTLKSEYAEAVAEMPERWASMIDDEFIAKSDELRARMT